MARIEYTALVSSMRGKLNGNVLTRNKGGEVIRNKVTPINPRTSAQMLQRAYTSNIAKAWAGTLTDAQRQSWKSYGQTIGAKSIFGNNLILSGIATFQRINRIVLNSGGTLLTTAPIGQDVPSILSLALTASVGPSTLSIAFDPSPLTGTQGIYLFACPPVSAGISNVSSSLRFVKFFSAPTSPLNILTAWEAVFGSFPTAAGQRIAVTAQVVDSATGAISAATGASTLVV